MFHGFKTEIQIRQQHEPSFSGVFQRELTRFEDIEAWKAARALTNRIYAVTSEGAFSKDHGLRDQIQRAAISMMANIAEGFDGGSDREFIKFLGYAIRSATELQSHLYVALDRSYIDQKQFHDL
jgi:four helix bundle protein